MRIAQLAPLYESVPPAGYGGTERVVSYLTEALIELGHDVTLFASADSRTSARLVACADQALRLDPSRPDELAAHLIEIERAFQAQGDFDVIHSHLDHLPFSISRRSAVPCVTTLHGRLDLPHLLRVYEEFREPAVVSISDSQRRPLPRLNWAGTVLHGLPQDLYRYSPRPDGYLAFVGRISPEKRVDRAIEIAIHARRPLRIAAKIDRADAGYFEGVRPLLDHPLVEFVGELDDAAKNDFLGGASALLFPIDWPEPFGLTMIEAFACGTPVVAWHHGSVLEVVEHGRTGFICDSVSGAVEAVRSIEEISRRDCRSSFERRFTARRMALEYLGIYARLASGTAS